LIDATSREEMTLSFGTQEPVPPCSITMGISTILGARKIFITAWGDEKAEIIQKMVEGPITEAIPASFLQTHNDAHVS
jgi:glucosamine-6-phosphate deaminase